MMNRILVVDDDQDICFHLSAILKEGGFNVLSAANGREALLKVKSTRPELVLLDLRLPDLDGMKVLERMKESDPGLDVIIITAFMDVRDAIQAMKLRGPMTTLPNPLTMKNCCLPSIRRSQVQQLRNEIDALKNRLAEKLPLVEEMGNSQQIKKVLTKVDLVAPTDFTIIIQGESGTGKEVMANLIHQKSLRKDNAFVPIDCSAIPETLIEAELFGHEKGAFTGADGKKAANSSWPAAGLCSWMRSPTFPSIQAKLLRVLQKKAAASGGRWDIRIDVRLIVASKVNLFEAVKQGRFRDDLYYRLNEFLVEIPKLCEREDDIAIFANHFLELTNRELHKKILGIRSEAMKLLFEHKWPGNVRELKNTIRRAVLIAGTNYITPSDILFEKAECDPGTGPGSIRVDDKRVNDVLEGTLSLKEMTNRVAAEIEKEVIRKVLLKTGGNKSRAAKFSKSNASPFMPR